MPRRRPRHDDGLGDVFELVGGNVDDDSIALKPSVGPPIGVPVSLDVHPHAKPAFVQILPEHLGGVSARTEGEVLHGCRHRVLLVERAAELGAGGYEVVISNSHKGSVHPLVATVASYDVGKRRLR